MAHRTIIKDNKPFISNTAEYLCNRALVWSEDDELNVALIAFNRAYESEKEVNSNFLCYAYALINSALLQYFIKLDKCPNLIFVPDNKIYTEYINSISEFEIYFDDKERALEIVLLTEELKKYSITFEKLKGLALVNGNFKDNLLNLVIQICRSEEITKEILLNKRFNSLHLSALTKLAEKEIKNYKNYIIMLLLILHSDKYLYLKAYLSIRVGDFNA